MRSLCERLEALALARYASVFEENGVNLESARLLNDTDLETPGVLLDHRKKLLNAIATLGPEQVTEPPSAESASKRVPLTTSSSSAGERRQLTVLFCDMVGFTELANRVDPEVLQKISRMYQDACVV
jgi:hypothetical protein